MHEIPAPRRPGSSVLSYQAQQNTIEATMGGAYNGPMMTTPLASHDYRPGEVAAALEFLKRTRWELRQLRWVRVWKDRMHVVDVNRDVFEIRGIGYAEPDIVPLLRMVNAAYDPETIHQ